MEVIRAASSPDWVYAPESYREKRIRRKPKTETYEHQDLFRLWAWKHQKFITCCDVNSSVLCRAKECESFFIFSGSCFCLSGNNDIALAIYCRWNDAAIFLILLAV